MKNNLSRREQKREQILESARKVFAKKGFIDVTMKDIIEEAGISRGGIYLYFDSVDMIFIEVVKERTTRKFDYIRRQIIESTPFDQLFNEYLTVQKDRLLNSIQDSLLRAMYEYYFTHKSKDVRDFQKGQISSTRDTILTIFQLGVTQGAIINQGLEELAENYMFVIEGLSVLALTGGLDENTIDAQFSILAALLPKVQDEKLSL